MRHMHLRTLVQSSCKNTHTHTHTYTTSAHTYTTSAAMPMFTVHTNVARSAVPAAFVSEATVELAKALRKPEQYVAVRVNPDQMMVFGGTDDPCALCSLGSIGGIDGLQEKHTKLLSELLKKHLGIPSDRVYISFENLKAANVGWNNSTFG
ncbi:hypothetical protein NHX12_011261 [Muraenolepis orangiensis]|uniref:Macrophage migration inhibitory factor n=1 Tax=Muraenolepis orangiensis TaxID=630683 RepID=A0A9Q0I6H9_9TELE|nr:hypothetical protein NHX12_011261 [Muraenolepis orangiensis]